MVGVTVGRGDSNGPTGAPLTARVRGRVRANAMAGFGLVKSCSDAPEACVADGHWMHSRLMSDVSTWDVELLIDVDPLDPIVPHLRSDGHNRMG